MTGFAFIVETFGVKQTEIAKELGVSRVMINHLIHGKKPMSEERAKQLADFPMFKGINYEYFMKKSLTPSEQLEITKSKLHYESEPIEVEANFIDEDGNQQKVTNIYYTNQHEIHSLSREIERIKNTEKLVKDVNFLLINEKDYDKHFSFNEGTNLRTMDKVVSVLQGSNENHQVALKILLELIRFDSGEMWGDRYSFIHGKKEKVFAKELNILLEKYGCFKSDNNLKNKG